MQDTQTFATHNLANFKHQLLHWADTFKIAIYLDSNNYQNDQFSQYECLVAVTNQPTTFDQQTDTFENLKKLHQQSNNWLFGIFSYDLKNQIEPTLHSNLPDNIKMPTAYFFIPQILISIDKQLRINIQTINHHLSPQFIFQQINQTTIPNVQQPNIHLQNKLTHNQYIAKINQMKHHIKQGNIYEANFCQEFYAQNVQIHPSSLFHRLNQQTKAPFAAFLKYLNLFALCTSPERFLQKNNLQLIAQPIKGTIKRDINPQKDQDLKKQLAHNPKEQAENVMIVDLLRNDLSRIAQKASVKVNELFGVYTFQTVHHLISTISAQLKPDLHFTDALKNILPIGSMTGAPKISAMKIIEQLEITKRGLYAGTIGYITPNGNFDFNVVIRTLLYNQQNQYLSLQTGSAITHYANPQQEYNECLLKAHAIKEILQNLNTPITDL